MRRMMMLGLMLFPLTASAAGILPFSPVRTQIKQAATAAGFLGKGQGERLTIKTLSKPSMNKPGLVKATIWAKGTPGAGHGFPATKFITATAEFKVAQVVDGEIASPVKQGGQTWLHQMFLKGK